MRSGSAEAKCFGLDRRFRFLFHNPVTNMFLFFWSADPHQRRCVRLDLRAAAAAHGEVRLQQVRLHPRALLPEPGEGDQPRHLPRVPVTGRQSFSYLILVAICQSFWQCCGSGMFIPDPNFFHPGSASKNVSIWTQNIRGNMIRVVHPGSGFRILIFYSSRIPDLGVKKAPDPGSGSATLLFDIFGQDFVQYADLSRHFTLFGSLIYGLDASWNGIEGGFLVVCWGLDLLFKVKVSSVEDRI